jgi:hypothetical protein
VAAPRLCPRQSVDHADVGSGVACHHAVGLEGYEPALIPALGGNLLTFKRIVRIVPIFERVEIDDDQYPGSHIPLRHDGEGFADRR